MEEPIGISESLRESDVKLVTKDNDRMITA